MYSEINDVVNLYGLTAISIHSCCTFNMNMGVMFVLQSWVLPRVFHKIESRNMYDPHGCPCSCHLCVTPGQKLEVFENHRGSPKISYFPRDHNFFTFSTVYPSPFEGRSFLLTFSSYCMCSSFVVRAVLNFSVNAMARSAELFTSART